jgi:hypothetical protein
LLAIDAIVGEVHRPLGEVGKVAGISGVLVQIGFYHLEQLSPIGIGIGEIEVGVTGPAPRFVRVSHLAGDRDEGGSDLPDEQNAKSKARSAISMNVEKAAPAIRMYSKGKMEKRCLKPIPMSDNVATAKRTEGIARKSISL